MKEILKKYAEDTKCTGGTSDLALVIGNGINRYKGSEENSWESLLKKLSNKHLNRKKIPKGISLTEFYDILDLSQDISGKKPQEASGKPLQKEFCSWTSKWQPSCHHKRIAAWANNNDVPVLTTNFDNTLGKAFDKNAIKCTLRRITDPHQQKFTDYYPWNSYYGLSDLNDPCGGFGIWHINGLEHYHRSVRLGLLHYMGSVQRVRGWLHGGKRPLFSSKPKPKSKISDDWQGRNTWLHIVFNKNLLFFGIGLDENEIFLRWLLIQRERYFQFWEQKDDPKMRKRAWYIHTDKSIKKGKSLFLKSVGVVPVKVCNHDCIYSPSMFPC